MKKQISEGFLPLEKFNKVFYNDPKLWSSSANKLDYKFEVLNTNSWKVYLPNSVILYVNTKGDFYIESKERDVQIALDSMAVVWSDLYLKDMYEIEDFFKFVNETIEKKLPKQTPLSYPTISIENLNLSSTDSQIKRLQEIAVLAKKYGFKSKLSRNASYVDCGKLADGVEFNIGFSGNLSFTGFDCKKWEWLFPLQRGLGRDLKDIEVLFQLIKKQNSSLIIKESSNLEAVKSLQKRLFKNLNLEVEKAGFEPGEVLEITTFSNKVLIHLTADKKEDLTELENIISNNEVIKSIDSDSLDWEGHNDFMSSVNISLKQIKESYDDEEDDGDFSRSLPDIESDIKAKEPQEKDNREEELTNFIKSLLGSSVRLKTVKKSKTKVSLIGTNKGKTVQIDYDSSNSIEATVLTLSVSPELLVKDKLKKYNSFFLGDGDLCFQKEAVEPIGSFINKMIKFKNPSSLREDVNPDNEDAVLDLDRVETLLDNLFSDFNMESKIEGGTLTYGYLEDGDTLEITEEGEVSYDGLMELATKVFSEDSEIDSFDDEDDLNSFLSDFASAFTEVMEALEETVPDSEDEKEDVTEEGEVSESYNPKKGGRVVFELEGEVYGGQILTCENLSVSKTPNWNIVFLDEENEIQNITQDRDGALNFKFSRLENKVGKTNSLLEQVENLSPDILTSLSEGIFRAVEVFPELSIEQVFETLSVFKGGLFEGFQFRRTVHGLVKQRTGLIHHTAAQIAGFRHAARIRARKPKMSATIRNKIKRSLIKAHRKGFFKDALVTRRVGKFGLQQNRLKKFNSSNRFQKPDLMTKPVVQHPQLAFSKHESNRTNRKNPFLMESNELEDYGDEGTVKQILNFIARYYRKANGCLTPNLTGLFKSENINPTSGLKILDGLVKSGYLTQKAYGDKEEETFEYEFSSQGINWYKGLKESLMEDDSDSLKNTTLKILSWVIELDSKDESFTLTNKKSKVNIEVSKSDDAKNYAALLKLMDEEEVTVRVSAFFKLLPGLKKVQESRFVSLFNDSDADEEEELTYEDGYLMLGDYRFINRKFSSLDKAQKWLKTLKLKFSIKDPEDEGYHEDDKVSEGYSFKSNKNLKENNTKTYTANYEETDFYKFGSLAGRVKAQAKARERSIAESTGRKFRDLVSLTEH